MLNDFLPFYPQCLLLSLLHSFSSHSFITSSPTSGPSTTIPFPGSSSTPTLRSTVASKCRRPSPLPGHSRVVPTGPNRRCSPGPPDLKKGRKRELSKNAR